MNKEIVCLSNTRLNRIRAQGYFDYSDIDITELSFGNRFAYLLCASILLIGVVTANLYIIGIMMVIAFFAILLPYHPFDYIYNHLLRQRMNKPKLPPRSPQLKFACIVATLWLAGTIYLFASGMTTAGYVFGAIIVGMAFTVSLLDLCIPSIVYNFVFPRKTV